MRILRTATSPSASNFAASASSARLTASSGAAPSESSLVNLPLDQLLRKEDRRSEVVSVILLGFVEVAPKETCGRIRDELGGRMLKDLVAQFFPRRMRSSP